MDTHIYGVPTIQGMERWWHIQQHNVCIRKWGNIQSLLRGKYSDFIYDYIVWDVIPCQVRVERRFFHLGSWSPPPPRDTSGQKSVIRAILCSTLVVGDGSAQQVGVDWGGNSYIFLYNNCHRKACLLMSRNVWVNSIIMLIMSQFFRASHHYNS